MAEDPYEVQVLHYINPHQVWVRPLKPEPSGDRWRVEQVGVFGVVAQCCRVEPTRDRLAMAPSASWPPAVAAELRRFFIWRVEQVGVFGVVAQCCRVEPTRDRLAMAPSASWPPAVAAELRRFFRARTMWFSPALATAYSHSILDSNLYKLGEFYAQDEDDTFRKLSQVLQDSTLATYDPQTFTECLEMGSLPLKLNTVETNKVLEAIERAPVDIPPHQWKEMVHNQMHVYFHQRRFENDVREKIGVMRSLETKNMIANKEADFEFSCKGVDYDFLIANDKLENHQSVNRKTIVDTIKALKKNDDSFQNDNVTPKLVRRLRIANEIMAKKNKDVPRKNKEFDAAPNAGINDTELRVSDNREKYQVHWRGDGSEEEIQITSLRDRKYFSNVGEDSFLDSKTLNTNGPAIDLENSINALKFAPKQVGSSRHVSHNIKDLDSQSSLESSSTNNSSLSNGLLLAGDRKDSETNVTTTECSEHETSASSEAKELRSELKQLNKNRLYLMEKLKDKKEQQKYKNIGKTPSKHSEQPRKALIEEIVEDPKKLIEEIIEPSKSKMITDTALSVNRLIEEIDYLDSPIQPLSIIKTTPEKKEDEHLKYELLKNKNNTDLIEKMLTPSLMIHSKNNIRVKPVIELKKIHFTDKIHKILIDMGNKIPLTLQTVSWPCILRGYSYFTVNPKGSNDAMAYEPAVCRLVVDNKDTHNSGPVCIIICNTARSVDRVVGTCNTFLKGEKVVLFCYAGVDKIQLTRNLLNGCDILVCTPFYLSELFSYGHFSLDLSCLSIVVLDGCDMINKLYAKEFQFFYSQINKMLSVRINKHHQIQFIATANEWCNLMLQLSLKASNSVVCFGSFQECVVYSKVHTSVVFDMVGSKVDTVLEFLKEVDVKKRTVIVCKTNEEVAELEKKLTTLQYTVLIGGTNLSIQQVGKLNDQWFQYNSECIAPILLCCDENLRYLNIKDAHYLVHFSLPSTYASFCRRFSVLIDNLKSIFDNDSKSEAKVKIVCDSENTEELPKLLNFMKRCTNNIPAVLNEISEKILIEKDKAKARLYISVCDSLLALGECPDFWYCDKRHTFCLVRDNPTEWVPKSGRISFKILHYHTAVHYSAQVTSFTVDGKKTDLPPNGTKKIAMKMNVYFCNENNRKLHGVPKPGDICAVSLSSGYYERCQVNRILTHYGNGKDKHVVVNLIDEEKEHIVEDVELFHLPEKFKNMLSYVVQVRLGNIRPKDKDVSFSEMSKNYLMHLLKEEERTYLRAKIALVVGNTVIVEDLEACQDMSTTSDTVVRCRVKDALCENHTEPNEKHLPKLIKLSERSGFKLPREIEKQIVFQKEVKLLPKPQWAHLESDDFPLVYFSSAVNPGKFYVRLVHFEACLESLKKNIQKHIDSLKDQEESHELRIGDFVIAKFPDDLLYYRARIDDAPNKDSNVEVKCFFVDHGEWRSVSRVDVRPITDYFITVLPFQAIECRLIGLQPVGEEWNDWSTHYFIDRCFQDAADDSLRELYVKHLAKEPAECTGGHKYGILMIDTSYNEDVIINDIMLRANVAVVSKAEQHFLENIEFKKPEKLKDSDDDSDIIDEEWRKDAAPFKNMVYEMKLDLSLETDLPQPTTLNSAVVEKLEKHNKQGETSSRSSFDADAFDVVYSDDDVYDILGFHSKPTDKKSLLQLTDADECMNENISYKTDPSTVTSSCSSYEVMATPRIIELDSDDLSSSEPSACGIITKYSNMDSVEMAKNNLSKRESMSKLDSTRSNKRIPKLSWHQTKTSVTVKVEISDIVNYKLDIDRKNMTFETYIHDTEYGFTINFYGVVDPEKCTHSPKGLYVLIKLTKLLKLNWLNLAEGDKKRWIMYNPDSVGDDLNEEDGDRVVMKKELDEFLKERAIVMDDDDQDDALDDDDDFRNFS